MFKKKENESLIKPEEKKKKFSIIKIRKYLK